jgi:Fe-S cluster assembly scaffold protein SufB
MNSIEKSLLEQVADLHEVPAGAYNIREDGALHSRQSTENIEIVTKQDKPGIEIRIKPGTKKESVHIPVLITKTGYSEMVYNDFFVGEDADVLIVAGCGIHNGGSEASRHDGIHTFYLGKNARIKYVEKHYGEGSGTGERVMNPQTVVFMEEGSYLEMETVQIKGVDNTKRYTKIEAAANCEIMITEKLMTHDKQTAESEMDVFLNGSGSKARVISRSVAQNDSEQTFYPRVTGMAECFGHVQCDSIIMDNAKVRSIPAISANHVNAQLIHEAAIGKIAGDQLLKLMTLGLSEEEAEERILSGFLK